MFLIPREIYVNDDLWEQIDRHGLRKQFDKLLFFLQSGEGYSSHRFRIRKPKKLGIRYARLTKKWRVYGRWCDEDFVIEAIDDHQ